MISGFRRLFTAAASGTTTDVTLVKTTVINIINTFLSKANSLSEFWQRKQAVLSVVNGVQDSANYPALFNAMWSPDCPQYNNLKLELQNDTTLMSGLKQLAKKQGNLISLKVGVGYEKRYTDEIRTLNNTIEAAQFPEFPLIASLIGQYCEISHYPKDNTQPSSTLTFHSGPKAYKIIRKGYEYLFFIDRYLCKPENDISRRIFGPRMFDPSRYRNNRESDPLPAKTDSYVGTACSAYTYLQSCSNVLLLDNLTKCVECMVPPDTDIHTVLNFFHEGIGGAAPYGYIFYRYAYSSESLREFKTISERTIKANIPQKFFNGNTEIVRAGLDPETQEFSFAYNYLDKTIIESTLSKFVVQYNNNLIKAKNDDEKTAATLLFVSLIECAHFFCNANSRLAIQILFPLLLEKQGLPPAVLFMPNGISIFVLVSLAEYMDKNRVDTVPDLPELTNALKEAMYWVKEGQEFFRQMSTNISL